MYHVGYGAGYDKSYSIAQKANYERALEQIRTKDTLEAIEREKNAQIAKITTSYNEALRNDKQKFDDIISGYERGELRLRERFEGCNKELPHSDSTGRDIEEKTSGLQSRDVEFLIRFSERADETALALDACQGVLSKFVD